MTIFFLSLSRSKTLRTYSKLLFLKTRMSLWSTAARCNFRFYEVKNGAMETILGPIQRPFVSVTALFVLREDVEYVTINPDSTINFVGENSAAWCDSNLRHPARLSSFVPWKKKEEKKNYEIFSFHANPFKTFFLSFLPPRQIYVRDFVRIWISSLTFSGIYLFDHGPHGIWIIIFACWFNYWIKRRILKMSISASSDRRFWRNRYRWKRRPIGSLWRHRAQSQRSTNAKKRETSSEKGDSSYDVILIEKRRTRCSILLRCTSFHAIIYYNICTYST